MHQKVCRTANVFCLRIMFLIPSSRTTGPSVRIYALKHTSALSFISHSFADSSPGPLEVKVLVNSDETKHEIRVELPAKSRPGLAPSSTLVSAFRNSDHLLVHAGECYFRVLIHY